MSQVQDDGVRPGQVPMRADDSCRRNIARRSRRMGYALVIPDVSEAVAGIADPYADPSHGHQEVW